MLQKNRIINIANAKPKEEDIYLIDTNILIKILYPVAFDGNIENYEKFYANIQEKHAKMLITSIQLSEFINRCIRFQFELYREEHLDMEIKSFKYGYRETEDYNKSMNSILEIVESDIVANFQFVSDKLEEIDKKNIFRYGFSYDFNDALLTEVAKIYGATIVTDDGDFSNYVNDVSIVTGNGTLLRLTKMINH